MNYVVYTKTGKSPAFDDIFNSNKLNIKLEKDIKNGVGFIILHPEEANETVISFDLSAFNNAKGGNRFKKFFTKSKKYINNTKNYVNNTQNFVYNTKKYVNKTKKYVNNAQKFLNNAQKYGKSKKYSKSKKYGKSKNGGKTTKRNIKKYNLVGGIKINKTQILIIVAFLINFLFFPIVLPGDSNKGPRSSDWKIAGLTPQQEQIINNIEIDVIPGSLSIEELNIQTVGVLRESDQKNIDIFSKTMNSDFSDLIRDKQIAIANINNSVRSPSYQLSNLMPKLAFPDVGITKFTYAPNRLYGITSNWILSKETGMFNIELYNITDSKNLANLPENKELYTLVKNTMNEQLQKMNGLGMIPPEASEGWFDLYLGQFAPKSQVSTFNSPYHFDGHSTLMDTNLGLNNPRSDDLELDALREKIRFSRPYGRNESLTPTTFFVSPFSSIQTMTYGSPFNEDRASFKMVDSDGDSGIVMEGEEGETTTYLDQSKGIQHASMPGNTVPFPFSAGTVRYLMIGNIMPKIASTQEVGPNIIKNKITAIEY